MGITAKLQRLRQQQASSAVSASGQSQRLQQTIRRVRPVAAASVDDERLAAMVGARRLSDGVLLIERQLAAAHAAPHPAGLPDSCRFGHPADWVYLDTETSGLSGGSGNLAFLIGVARLQGGGRVLLRQYLLTTFAGERAMLTDLLEWIGGEAVIVTFNGKCFDAPLLDTRQRLNRVAGRLAGIHHLDLLYPLRRLYRKHWPDCRLQTAERRLLGFQRQEDLPGSEAPVAWQRWLRQGDPDLLCRVVQHNRQDVLSMPLLHSALVGQYASPDVAADKAAVARSWFRHDRERAITLLEHHADPYDHEVTAQLAEFYRQTGQWINAVPLWQRLVAYGDDQAHEALSKYYEHRCRDFRRALQHARQLPSRQSRRLQRLQEKLGATLSLPLEQADDV